MKKLNTTFNGSLNYLAGISSPTAANLSVQGFAEPNTVETNPTREQVKREHNVNAPFTYLAGVSSPTAANVAVQGLTDTTDSKYFRNAEVKKTSVGQKILEALSRPNPTTMGYDGTDPRNYLKYRY